jgi:hypothetical protein
MVSVDAEQLFPGALKEIHDALSAIDMRDEHQASFLRGVIRFRHDKHTQQIEVRTAADIETVAALGWFEESAAWGGKQCGPNNPQALHGDLL